MGSKTVFETVSEGSYPSPQAKAHSRWYKKNKEKRKQQIKERTANLRQWLIEYRATLSCQLCGENHPACIDFHHRSDETKKYNVCEMPSYGCSIETMIHEIAKCDVLCANCHRKTHWRGDKITPT